MTFLRIQPQRLLSELLLKQHGKVLTVKLENLREIKQIPPTLKLVPRQEASEQRNGQKIKE